MCKSLQGRVAIIAREPLYSSKFTALHAELTDDNTLPGTPATGILKFFILKGPVTFNRWNGIFSMYKLYVFVYRKAWEQRKYFIVDLHKDVDLKSTFWNLAMLVSSSKSMRLIILWFCSGTHTR